MPIDPTEHILHLPGLLNSMRISCNPVGNLFLKNIWFIWERENELRRRTVEEGEADSPHPSREPNMGQSRDPGITAWAADRYLTDGASKLPLPWDILNVPDEFLLLFPQELVPNYFSSYLPISIPSSSSKDNRALLMIITIIKYINSICQALCLLRHFTSGALSQFIFTRNTTYWCRYYYPHSTNWETEADRGQITCPRSHSP